MGQGYIAQRLNLQPLLRLAPVAGLPSLAAHCFAGMALSGAALQLQVLPLVLGVAAMHLGVNWLGVAYRTGLPAPQLPGRAAEQNSTTQPATLLKVGYGALTLGGLLCCSATLWSYGGTLQRHGLATALSVACLAVANLFATLRASNSNTARLVAGLNRAVVYLIAALTAGGGRELPLWLALVSTWVYVSGSTYALHLASTAPWVTRWPLTSLALPAAGLLLWAEPNQTTWAALAVYALWQAYALVALLVPKHYHPQRAESRLMAGLALADGLWTFQAGATDLTLLCACAFVGTCLIPHLLKDP